MHAVRLSMVAALLALAVACGSDDRSDDGSDGAGSSTSGATSSPTRDVMAEPTVSGTFPVGGDHLVMRCWGTGAPAYVFEAGTDSSGLLVFPTALVRPLAEDHQACLYDRVGTGSSSQPTTPRRTIDEVVGRLHRLLDKAGVEQPVVLVGQSGGGNLAVQYAARFGEDVAGLVLLDVPAPAGDLGKEFPGAKAWRNPEHIDWVDAESRQARIRMPVGDFPVLVVTATDGQSDEQDQSYWLDLSDHADQVVMEGGHDIHEDDPEGVAEQIRAAFGG
jgi:pimeloyl-ACP methyl ester carboxylesterase